MPLINKNHLFIHIPKNAGRSIEEFFSVRNKNDLLKPPRRNLLNLFAKYLLNISCNSENKNKLWGSIDYVLCSQHLSYQEIELLELINLEQLSRIKTFAVVRNPFSRAVSTFKHFKKDHESFETFIHRFFKNTISSDHNKIAHRRSQLDFLIDTNGDFCVDDILRFENIINDFEKFCKKYNYKNPNNLKHIGKNSDEFSYRNYYNTKTKEIISDIFSDDLNFFEYDF